jgi:hypothetical protein
MEFTIIPLLMKLYLKSNIYEIMVEKMEIKKALLAFA